MYKAWLVMLTLTAFGCAAEVSEKDRLTARIQYDLGVEFLSKGNVTQALQSFLQSERLDQSFPDLHNALGLVYMAINRYDEAVAHFERALALKPTYSDVHNNLGTVYLLKGNYDKAIAEFRIALKDVLYNTPSHAEGNLGFALYKKGERAQGIKHIKNATLVNPKFCRGYMWLGEIYQTSGEYREAERYLDRFIERCVLDPAIKSSIDPSSMSEVYMRMGQVELAAGNLPRAKTSFEQCLQAGRDTPYFEACDKGLRQLR